MDRQQRKRLIEEQTRLIREHEAERRKLIDECPHEFRPLTKEELTDKWMSIGARCEICRTPFGWRCKRSPDGVCHYFSVDGEVELIDGTIVTVPSDHNPDDEDEDGCIFCGMPDERK